MKNSMIRFEGGTIHVDAILAAGSAAVLLAGGIATGWILCRRDLERDYQERLDTEVDATRKHFYGTLAKEGLLPVEAEADPADDHPAGDEPDLHVGTEGITFEDHNGGEEDQVSGGHGSADDDHAPGSVVEAPGTVVAPDPRPAPSPVTQNVFEGRDLNGPFEISLDEFVNVEPSWMQLTLHCYVEDDGVLVITDDKDAVVPAYAKLCGQVTRDQFNGEVSGDPTIIYRRNVATGADYEIVLQDVSYKKGVLGYGEPL